MVNSLAKLLSGTAWEDCGRRSQPALRDNPEEQYRLLTENVKDFAIFLLDKDGLRGPALLFRANEQARVAKLQDA
jgi:hypothetical protein